MLDVGTINKDVDIWLRTAENTTRTRSGRAVYAGNTLYWNPPEKGKSGKRWSIKAYNKLAEFHANPAKNKDRMKYVTPDMLSWLNNKLRVELTLGRQTLDDDRGFDYENYEYIEEYFFNYIEKIIFSNMDELNMINNIDNINLTPSFKTTLVAFSAGIDVTSLMSRKTFYRHRKSIMAETGIDITIPFKTQQKPTDNIVTFKRLIDLKPCEYPEEIFKGHVAGY
jgi:II/X family phage/plasmid replication protein